MDMDGIIARTEVAEVAAIEQGEGARTLAFVLRIEGRAARRWKKELVAGGHLPDTPDPVKPKPKGSSNSEAVGQQNKPSNSEAAGQQNKPSNSEAAGQIKGAP